MFYLLFQYKKDQEEKGFQRFDNKEELVAFLCKNIDHFSTHIIIEPKKEYRFGLVEVAEKKEGLILNCKNCGGPISIQNATGYCGRCASGSRIEESGKKCSNCGSKIAEWNKSGVCSRCRTISQKEFHSAQRKEKRAVQKLIKEGPPKEGKCNRCEIKFKLEDWQHSSMHWCPECRLSPDYKGFKEMNRQRV